MRVYGTHDQIFFILNFIMDNFPYHLIFLSIKRVYIYRKVQYHNFGLFKNFPTRIFPKLSTIFIILKCPTSINLSDASFPLYLCKIFFPPGWCSAKEVKSYTLSNSMIRSRPFLMERLISVIVNYLSAESLFEESGFFFDIMKDDVLIEIMNYFL